MIEQVLSALLAVVAAIGASVTYFYGSNWLLDRLVTDRRTADGTYVSRQKTRDAVRPWLFLAPALLVLGVYLVYPVVETLRLSFFGKSGDGFVGLANWTWAVGNDGVRTAVRNNVVWLLVVPSLSTVFGLLVATLADRVAWGNVAKSLVFMPMAISFVGASVIWKFVYDYRGAGSEQIGILNALVVALGGEPQAWITVEPWNNFLLMVILVWIQTGFAMVILSAALRGVPEETIEAARIDGASDVAVFFRIIIPQIFSTILVVWTTITIVVLKIFDIVAAMTNGQWGTEVLANAMYNWMFRGGGHFGRGSVIALMIMIAVIPIMAYNIRRFREEEARR
ncbi:MAG: sugar ABC transporter permease [Trueperaceae bacterium]|nr:sugar ABC transporter permease [Trueperaceae bacterium]